VADIKWRSQVHLSQAQQLLWNEVREPPQRLHSARQTLRVLIEQTHPVGNKTMLIQISTQYSRFDSIKVSTNAHFKRKMLLYLESWWYALIAGFNFCARIKCTPVQYHQIQTWYSILVSTIAWLWLRKKAKPWACCAEHHEGNLLGKVPLLPPRPLNQRDTAQRGL